MASFLPSSNSFQVDSLPLLYKSGRGRKSKLKTKLKLELSKSKPKLKLEVSKSKSKPKLKLEVLKSKSKLKLKLEVPKAKLNLKLKVKVATKPNILYYDKDVRCFVENNNIHYLTSEQRLRKFPNRYNNIICRKSLLLPQDEPTKSIQTVNSIQFTGVIQDLHKSKKCSLYKNLYKNHTVKNDLVSITSSIFQLIYHMNGSNQLLLVSESTSKDP